MPSRGSYAMVEDYWIHLSTASVMRWQVNKEDRQVHR